MELRGKSAFEKILSEATVSNDCWEFIPNAGCSNRESMLACPFLVSFWEYKAGVGFMICLAMFEKCKRLSK